MSKAHQASAAPSTRSSLTRPFWDKHGEALTTVLCGLFVLAGVLAQRAGGPASLFVPLYLAGYVLGGYRQAIDGVQTLVRDRELDVDLLMVVAAIGAAAIGYWGDGALLIFIFALSGTLEGYASARTQRDLEALLNLNPEEATVERAGRELRVPASTLQVGDTVIVRPGERIPGDGRILAGQSSVNEASITGESIPVDKRETDEVFAGSINGSGALRVGVTRNAGDTVLARIITLVRDAQENRPATQLFIERFERGYARVVVLGAVLFMLVPTLAGWWTFDQALYRAMIFLVVASPCALAASMMPTLLSALSNGARRGILFKGSNFLEALGRVRAVAFDKTGTLTTGTPSVTEFLPLNGENPETLLATAAGVERLSEHPLARAIVRAAENRGLPLPNAEGTRALTGIGAEARVNGQVWRVGKPGLFGRVPSNVQDLQARLEAEGKTVVYAGDGEARLLIALRDTVRPEARETVAALRRQGVGHVVLLTGDAQETAGAVARELGITEVRAGLLPEDKIRAVQDLIRRYGPVAMVGDGVNDAPALAAATVGIAMGAGGTDVALETADVVLMKSDLAAVPYAVELGRKSLRVVKQNLTFALAVIVLLVVLNVLGDINLPLGVVGHEGSTLLVTLSGLRLLRGLGMPAGPGAPAQGRPVGTGAA